MTDEDHNRDVIQTMWRDFEDSHDWSILERYHATDYNRIGDRTINRTEWFEQLRALYEAFPDHRIEIQHTVTEGSSVAYRWRAKATHTGFYLGAPPTGRTAYATGITISQFRAGQIGLEYASWNKLAFLQSLGISTLRS